MDFSTLADFWRKTYACFTRAADALMNVADALLTYTPARSLAELSLSPFFERHWSSLYEAFQDAQIDRTALQKLFADYVPLPKEGERRWDIPENTLLSFPSKEQANKCGGTNLSPTYLLL